MKSVLAMDVGMAYPNNNIPLHNNMDASSYHMGAIFIQKSLL